MSVADVFADVRYENGKFIDGFNRVISLADASKIANSGSLKAQAAMKSYTAEQANADSKPISTDTPMDVASAIMTRQNYNDAVKTFQPLEDRLMGMTTYGNANLVNNEINSAIGTDGYVQRALDSSQGQTNRNFQRYGLAPSARQQAALSSNNTLTRSTSVVNAANNIRQKIRDRNAQIASGVSSPVAAPAAQ